MMPEAARVIDAARAAVAALPGFSGQSKALAALGDALENLDARLASVGGERTMEEQDRVWGEVVEGDEILSTKTGRWYEVRLSVKDDKGNVKIHLKSSPKPITRPVGDAVRLRRGVSGEAVDVLEVLFSGQTSPSEPETKDAGPMLGERVGDDA